MLALAGIFCAWGAGTVLGQTTSIYNSQSTKATTAKDQVATAFALPSGTVLNAKQQKAYDKLKADNTPSLYQALTMIKSNDKATSAKGLKQNREVRAKVKTSIAQILAMPYAGTPPAAASVPYQRPAAGGSCPCGRR